MRLLISLLLLAVTTILVLAPAGSSASLARPSPFIIDKCPGGRSSVISCNFGLCGGCMITDTLVVNDALDCVACTVTGGLSCGGQAASVPMAFFCESRHAVGGVCSGGPGFGCSLNWYVMLFCNACVHEG